MEIFKKYFLNVTLCTNTMEAEISYCQKVNTLISVLH